MVNARMESSIEIEERAGQWLAKRDSGAWSESDEAEFNSWLEQSTLHLVAFVRLEAAWNHARRLRALGANVRPGEVPTPEQWQLDPVFQRCTAPVSGQAGTKAATAAVGSRKRWGLVASILALIAAGLILYARPFGSTYRTPIGGVASVPMSDGSKVTLNTDSRIRVAVTETERRVELDRGEAFFEVAKDPSRPFVVAAGTKRVVAVGTQFSVRRDGDEVRVFIAEGTVRIEDATTPAIRVGTNEDSILTLSAGSIARASDAGVLIQETTVPEIETYLSWRTGHLTFRDTALADAIAEFNRYNDRKVVIEDPAVAAIRVSGKFRANQFEAFLRLMEQGFPVRARRVGEEIVLTDSRPPAAGNLSPD